MSRGLTELATRGLTYMSDNGLTQKSSTLPLSTPLQSRHPRVQNESRGLTEQAT